MKHESPAFETGIKNINEALLTILSNLGRCTLKSSEKKPVSLLPSVYTHFHQEAAWSIYWFNALFGTQGSCEWATWWASVRSTRIVISVLKFGVGVTSICFPLAVAGKFPHQFIVIPPTKSWIINKRAKQKWVFHCYCLYHK